MSEHDHLIEQVYSDALHAIAMGVPRDETRADLIDSYPALESDELNDPLADALRDALKQGVEREDIDPSWLA